MIGLIVNGCCQRCEHIDLRLENHLYYGAQKIYELHCIHEAVCGDLKGEACSIAQQDPKD